MAIAAPEAKILSIEISDANANISRAVHEHAGVDERVEVLVGSIGDDGQTITKLRPQYVEARGHFDFIFIDHDKKYYLPDLQSLLDNDLLHESAMVVADNVKFPAAPDYLAYMDKADGKTWRTKNYETHVEYQSLIEDLILVSERIH